MTYWASSTRSNPTCPSWSAYADVSHGKHSPEAIVMFSELFPIVLTADMARALAFYRDQLDGRVVFEYPGPHESPAYVGLEIGSAQLGIGLDTRVAGGALPRPISLWVYTDQCDAAVERLRKAGSTIAEEPADQPWGERVARVLDPDGNEIIIGQRL